MIAAEFTPTAWRLCNWRYSQTRGSASWLLARFKAFWQSTAVGLFRSAIKFQSMSQLLKIQHLWSASLDMVSQSLIPTLAFWLNFTKVYLHLQIYWPCNSAPANFYSFCGYLGAERQSVLTSLAQHSWCKAINIPLRNGKPTLQVCGPTETAAVEHLAVSHLKTPLHWSQQKTFTSNERHKKCPPWAIYQQVLNY